MPKGIQRGTSAMVVVRAPVIAPHRGQLRDAWIRNGQDEPSSTLLVWRQEAHDLLCKVPRENQHIIGLVGKNPIHGHDRYMRPGGIKANLQRTTINGIGKRFGSDPTVAKQRVPFCRRAITNDGFAPSLQARQQFTEATSVSAHAAGKTVVSLGLVQPRLPLCGSQLQGGAAMSSAFAVPRPKPQGTAMNR